MTGRKALRRWRDIRIGLVIVCAVATAAQWAREMEGVRSLEWEVYERFSKARDLRAYAERVALIEIDEDAYREFENKVPLPRDYLGRLITTLCEEAKPRAIGLDVILDEPASGNRWQEDATLEDALRVAKARGIPVVLACDVGAEGSGKPMLPLERFQPYGQLGHVSVIKSRGGEVREVDWLTAQDGRTFPAFAAALAALDRGQKTDEAILRCTEETARPRGRFAKDIVFSPHVRFEMLPSGAIQPGSALLHDLDGKLVLIGANSSWASDRHLTPLAVQAGEGLGDDRMPGVEIQAHAVTTLLAPGVRTLSSEWEWLLSAGVSALALLLLYRLGALWAFLIGGMLLVAGAVGALVLFATRGLLINLAPSLVAVLACAVVWWVRRALYLSACFDSFVSKPVLRGIGSVRDLQDFRPMTGQAGVMFCDMIAYSKACRHLSAEDAMRLSNHYLTPMTEVVERHGGMLERFTGDGFLAYFGAPLPGRPTLPPQTSALQASHAGVEIQKTVARLRREACALGLPEMEMAVGIHTGPLTAGLIGSRRRAQFTVMGDTVNDAARVESIGHRPDVQPPLQTRILLSQATADLLKDTPRLEARTYEPTEKYSAPVYELLQLQ